MPMTIRFLPLSAALLLLASCDKSAQVDQPCKSCGSSSATEIANRPEIFNGENLDGWECVLVDKSLSKEDVWSVQDGVLICKGEPLGYLHTQKPYQDFTLSFEWRWAANPTNSGLLLRIAAEPETFLPKCIEAQLQHKRAGDLYGFFGANIEGASERSKVIESPKIGTFKAVSHMKDAEKSAGEWNLYEVKVQGDTVELKINGELVNRASGIDIVAGPIGLQSEGSEIHFRNIELTEL